MSQAEEMGKVVSVDDAQRAAERYILGKHPKAQITFDKTALAQIGGIVVYVVEGKAVLTKGLLEEIFSTPAQKAFKIQVHAYSDKILGYEM